MRRRQHYTLRGTLARGLLGGRVCDLCGSDEDVKTYRVGVVGDGKGVAPDLCAEHRRPLDEVMAAVPKGRTATGLKKQPPVRSEAQVRKLRKRK